MNEALDNLYDELLRETDELGGEEEITPAEKARRFAEEKRIAIDKLREISTRKLEEEARVQEEARKLELERKRDAAVAKRIEKERQEKQMLRDIERRTVRFWTRGITGKRQETGLLYFGDAKRRGDAWVPHGHGEYRLHSEVIYEGGFCDGAMHGQGRLLFESGVVWDGGLWKDTVHGVGVLIAVDDSKKAAIYWQDRRVCFVDELVPGCRIQLLGEEFVRQSNGEAMITAATVRPGRYRVRLDSGLEKLVRLDTERFRPLRYKPRIMTLDSIVGSTACRKMYDYEHDQAHPSTTAYRENFYWPDLWAGREKAEQERQEALEIEAKREQILSRRQAERDKRRAAAEAADVVRGLEEDSKQKEQMELDNAAAAERNRKALEAARESAEAKKKRNRDLSTSPLKERR